MPPTRNRTGYDYRGPVTRKLPIFILLLLLLTIAPVATGCGEDTPTTQTVAPTVTTVVPRDYSNSIADTGMLLRDSSSAMKQVADTGMGVHFSYISNVFGEEQLVIAQGEGDMVFPDRTKVTSSVYITESPTIIELIAIGETVYIRTSDSGEVWRRDDRGVLPPNPRNVWNYLDFARSSRNLGKTTLDSGIQAYQVQVDIDADLLSTESMKYYGDPGIIAMLETARSSVVTATVWIGVEDLLVYKQSISTSNPLTGTGSEQQLTYSQWGEAVEIIQPCTLC
jgi:hypothetical protein